MAIGAESLVIGNSSATEVAAALGECLPEGVYARKAIEPVRSPAQVVPFERKKRRFFFIDEYESGLCAVAEIADLADRALARDLSRRLPRVYWIALHEAENAWGLECFVGGELERSQLHPAKMLAGEGEDEYDQDATAEAFRAAEAIGDFEPFCSYNQRANGYTPEGVVKSAHLAFFKGE